MWGCAPEIRSRLISEGASKYPHAQEALQNGLRHLLLETLHRLGHHEPLRAHASTLMTLLLKLMESENEDNSILALKIIIDLHRSYKDTIGNTAVGFLDLVKKVYGNMGEVIAKTFGDENGNGFAEDDDDSNVATSATGGAAAGGGAGGEAGTPGSTSAPTPAQAQTPGSATLPVSARSTTSQSVGGDNPPIRRLPQGMKSLKLLAECPIAVVFLFQTYRDIVPNELRIFVPLVFQVSV